VTHTNHSAHKSTAHSKFSHQLCITEDISLHLKGLHHAVTELVCETELSLKNGEVFWQD
jgi:hypothetical protein